MGEERFRFPFLFPTRPDQSAERAMPRPAASIWQVPKRRIETETNVRKTIRAAWRTAGLQVPTRAPSSGFPGPAEEGTAESRRATPTAGCCLPPSPPPGAPRPAAHLPGAAARCVRRPGGPEGNPVAGRYIPADPATPRQQTAVRTHIAPVEQRTATWPYLGEPLPILSRKDVEWAFRRQEFSISHLMLPGQSEKVHPGGACAGLPGLPASRREGED